MKDKGLLNDEIEAEQLQQLAQLLKSPALLSACSPEFHGPPSTPADGMDDITPNRVHQNTLKALHSCILRASTPNTVSLANGETSSSDEESDSEGVECDDARVSPLDMESLKNGPRSGLRKEVRERLYKLKYDLQNAKQRLNHVEHELSSSNGSREGEDSAFVSSTGEHMKAAAASTRKAADECDQAPYRPAAQTSGDDEPNVSLNKLTLDENADNCRVQSESALVEVNVDENTYLPKACKTDEIDEDDREFTIAASHVPGSAASSRIARRIGGTEAFITPKRNIPMRRLTTPYTKLSTARYVGTDWKKTTPVPSSSVSTSSPSSSMLDARPSIRFPKRMYDRKPSESEEKEFRRRAAALKIHVSPYFKKKNLQRPHSASERQEIDTVL